MYANQKVKVSMFIYETYLVDQHTTLQRVAGHTTLNIWLQCVCETFNLLVQGHANSSDVILIGTCNTLHSVIFNLGTLHVTWNL